jgi:3-dehydroquinate synthase
VDVLRTLPRRELLAGLAEVIKYAATLDEGLFDDLDASLERLLAHEPEALIRVVAACCRLKAAVVGADETEQGSRAVLNFGHTLGHAIEAVTGYTRYLHGEAVAIGLVFAARLSAARGYCDHSTADRIRRLVERAGLPSRVPADLDPEALARAITVDKKTRDGVVRFVCLDGLGATRFEPLTGAEIVGFLRAEDGGAR